jgi:peptide/nickel transport system permease protein
MAVKDQLPVTGNDRDAATLVEIEPTPAGQLAAAATQLPPRRVRLDWARRLIANKKALVGIGILVFFLLVAIFAPIIAPVDPSDFVARPNRAPTAQHIFGTTGQGQDVFAQTVWGTRISLGIGFAVGLIITVLGAIVGMTAGYFGGRVDDILSLITNVVLIIPGLPLLITLAAFLPPSPLTIAFVLSITSWAWNARVFRSQTLSLREKDFVSASIVSGESTPYIIFREILPNMTSIAAGALFSSTLYAIGAEAGLEFLGLGNVSMISWGTILYWAANNAGLLTGAWWSFVPAGLCIALVAFAFAMINYAMDEITNPRLRAEKETARVVKDRSLRTARATPVVREPAQ